jgi:hypothetical protein
VAAGRAPVRVAVRRRADGLARAGLPDRGDDLFTQRTDEGRRARAEAAADDGGYETVVRDIWV